MFHGMIRNDDIKAQRDSLTWASAKSTLASLRLMYDNMNVVDMVCTQKHNNIIYNIIIL
jgi:hypothetical protein